MRRGAFNILPVLVEHGTATLCPAALWVQVVSAFLCILTGFYAGEADS
jgi:hypothetical protein